MKSDEFASSFQPYNEKKKRVRSTERLSKPQNRSTSSSCCWSATNLRCFSAEMCFPIKPQCDIFTTHNRMVSETSLTHPHIITTPNTGICHIHNFLVMSAYYPHFFPLTHSALCLHSHPNIFAYSEKHHCCSRSDVFTDSLFSTADIITLKLKIFAKIL